MRDAIELSSSPEPDFIPACHPPRGPSDLNPGAKAKGKAKAQVEVIELTDSDSDSLYASGSSWEDQSHLVTQPDVAIGSSTRRHVEGQHVENSLDTSLWGVSSTLPAGFMAKKSKKQRIATTSSKPTTLSTKPNINSTSSAGSLSNIPPENRPNELANEKAQGKIFVQSDEENKPPASPHGSIQAHPRASTPSFDTNPPPPRKPGGAAAPASTAAFVPPPLVETPEEAMARSVAQILEIIPDVDPDHLTNLVTEHYPKHQAGITERVLHLLFEDPNYPRAQKKLDKGKRKADNPEGSLRPVKKTKVVQDEVDYRSTDRPFVGGKDYHELALSQLQLDFPYTPKPFLRTTLASQSGFYVPTFLFLQHLEKQNATQPQELPYCRRKTPYRPTKARGNSKELADKEFDRELAWMKRQPTGGAGAADKEDVKGDEEDEVSEAEESDGEDDVDGIECGCCFSKFRFEKMIQCPDTHLFCCTCLRSYASTLLGTHNPIIKCMSQVSCTFSFSASELSRVLPKKLFSLYERLVQAKEIEEAGLEGLEECPFCEWKCVIENEDEKLFRCGNEEGGCGVVSCRKCGRLDHLPKSCREIEEDKKLDARHAVEEAMTQALMRNCPQCKKAFIKESGCNKMTCPNCRTLSCYICREIITGYEHFNQNPPGQATTSKSTSTKKCILWDKNLDEMHAIEIKKAAEKAIAEAKAANPDVADKDLKVDLPKVKNPPPPPPPNPYVVPHVHQQHPYIGANRAMNIVGHPVPQRRVVPAHIPQARVAPVAAPVAAPAPNNFAGGRGGRGGRGRRRGRGRAAAVPQHERVAAAQVPATNVMRQAPPLLPPLGGGVVNPAMRQLQHFHQHQLRQQALAHQQQHAAPPARDPLPGHFFQAYIGLDHQGLGRHPVDGHHRGVLEEAARGGQYAWGRPPGEDF